MDTPLDYDLPWADPVVPDYRPGKFHHWRCEPTPVISKPSTGYFLAHAYQPSGWMIKQQNTIWMSLAAMERESHMPHIAAAHGRVVVAGLGMGFITYNLSLKPEVTSITVLEKDPAVIALMDQISDWRKWPKIRLIMGDATEYKPKKPVDFLYADIWPQLGHADTLPLTQAIQANVKATKVGMWGQEMEFSYWCTKKDIRYKTVTDQVWKNFVKDTGLPLIGEEWPGYSNLAFAAVLLQLVNSRRVNPIDGHLLLHIYKELMEDYCNRKEAA